MLNFKRSILFLLLSITLLSIIFLNSCTPNGIQHDDEELTIAKRSIEKSFKNFKAVKLANRGGQSLVEPTGLCFSPDNYIYLVESEGSAIHILDTEGHYLRRFKLDFDSGDFLSFPESIIYSPDKTFFITDSSNSRVLKVSREGKVKKELKSDSPTGLFLPDELKEASSIEFNLPSGIFISDKGEIYIADTYNDRILQINLSGEQVWSFGDHGGETGTLQRPRDICVDRQGNIYVTDDTNHVKVISKRKGLIRKFGGTGTEPGKFNKPKGITLWHDQYLAVCDGLNGRIQFFTTSGYIITVINEIGRIDLMEPYAVKTDDFENLYIIDKKKSILFKIYQL